MKTSNRQSIFVSYSHRDKEWLERLRVHLKPVLRFADLDLWDDTRIKVGENWSKAINAAIDQTDIAILLISADFLASDFIVEHELMELLSLAESRGTVVLPIHIGSSLQACEPRLSELQAVNSPSSPLKALTENEADKVLIRLTERVLEISQAKAGQQRGRVCAVPLPRRNLDFVGRDVIVSKIKRALLARPSRIVILEGMGGIGKTTTGLTAVHDLVTQGAFADGILFSNLEGFVENRQPKKTVEVLEELIRSLNGQNATLPNDQVELQHLWQESTKGLKLLVFLDNVIDEDQIEPLLPYDDAISVLVTSRHKLDLQGAKHLELVQLERAAGERLALDLANKRQKNRITASDARRLAELCDGLPLAIEVAANAVSRSRGLTTKRLMAKLSKRSNSSNLLSPATEVLRLSVHQLPDEDQRRWQQLGVFRGGFHRDAVAAVWNIDDPDELLADLERRSLIDYDEGSDQYRLHDLLSSLAFDLLSDHPSEKLVAEERHARFFCNELRARTHHQAMAISPSIVELLAYFDVNRLNIESGQRWVASQLKGKRPADPTYVASLSQRDLDLWMLVADYGLGGIHMMMSRLDERAWIRWLVPWIRATCILEDIAHLQPFALAKLSLVLRWQKRFDCAKALLNSAELLVDDDRLSIDDGIRSEVLSGLASVYLELEHLEKALTYARNVRKLKRKLAREHPEHRKHEAWSVGSVGRVLHRLKGASSALPLYEEHLRMAHDIGNLQSEAAAHSYLGSAYMDLKRFEEATESFEHAAEITQTLGQAVQHRNMLFCLAAAAWKLGEHEQALKLMRKATKRSMQQRDRSEDQLTISLLDFCSEVGW